MGRLVKTVLSGVLLLFLLSGVDACRDYTEADVMSDVVFGFKLPEGRQPKRLHLEMTCTNINSREVFAGHNVEGAGEMRLSLMRGIYIVLVEGTMVYEEGGEERSCRLRGYMENLHFLEPAGRADLELENLDF